MDSKMNERIKQLAKEAALAEGWGPGVWQTTFTEKFAELIVKECANRATWAQDTGAADIGGEVLKHFGVEE
jgi:hypothetical protein